MVIVVAVNFLFVVMWFWNRIFFAFDFNKPLSGLRKYQLLRNNSRPVTGRIKDFAKNINNLSQPDKGSLRILRQKTKQGTRSLKNAL
jgi:hypothetical protein